MDQTKIKTLSLICPSCGGRMELSADEEKAVCPYCGHEMLIDNDDDAQKEYERRIAMARADEDIRDLQRKRQRGRRLKGWLIAICVIAVLNLVTVFIPDSPMRNLIFPKTADPFTAVSLKFSGMSGKGRAELQITDRSAEYSASTRYEVAPEKGLSNGDTVAVKGEGAGSRRLAL